MAGQWATVSFAHAARAVGGGDQWLIGVANPQTLTRSPDYFSAKAVRGAVEAVYQAELPRRAGRE
jgi:hypothetical protein